MGKVKTQKNAIIKNKQKAYLDKVKSGQNIIIAELPSGEIKSQLIRLGIAVESKFKCLKRLPGGTIVLVRKRQEIALGFDIASKISVIITDY